MLCATEMESQFSSETILAGFVIRLAEDEDEREYVYREPKTGRQFNVARSESIDDDGYLFQRFFLYEMAPNGRICKLDANGNCIDAWDDPRIPETESRVGPNSLMHELRRQGIDPEMMVFTGGGYGVGSVYYPSLAACAAAISEALANNERYRHHRPPTEQEQLRLARRSAVESVAYWEGRVASVERVWANEEGLFRGCFTMLGGALSGEHKQAILAYLNKPSLERWLDIRGFYVTGNKSLWEAWCDADLTAPRSGDVGNPDPETLRAAIRAAAEHARDEAATRLERARAEVSGLAVVR